MPLPFKIFGTSLEDLYVTQQDLIVQKLWSWGYFGGFCQGDQTHRSSPVQVGALVKWNQISAGYGDHVVAIKLNGELWSWGPNTSGQLGLGDSTSTSSPIQVGTLTDWSLVSAGQYHTLAIKTNGELWSWGKNTSFGQLGHGDTTSRSSPVQVGALTNWSKVSAGLAHSLAISTDGKLWSWGNNNFGQLGHGDRTPRSSPVQVGALTNWIKISAGSTHSMAIKTNGELWAWGNNGNGQLGNNDATLTHRSSPVQVGALTNWSKFSTKHSSVLAISTDGKLWSWGSNGYGQLGHGDRTPRSSPVQVGALTNWGQIDNGGIHTLAIKTNGELWAWGFNQYGELGNNDATLAHRSSPVQVGALTNWSLVSAGHFHSLAISA